MSIFSVIYDVYDGKMRLETPETAVISGHLAVQNSTIFGGGAPQPHEGLTATPDPPAVERSHFAQAHKATSRHRPPAPNFFRTSNTAPFFQSATYAAAGYSGL